MLTWGKGTGLVGVQVTLVTGLADQVLQAQQAQPLRVGQDVDLGDLAVRRWSRRSPPAARPSRAMRCPGAPLTSTRAGEARHRRVAAWPGRPPRTRREAAARVPSGRRQRRPAAPRPGRAPPAAPRSRPRATAARNASSDFALPGGVGLGLGRRADLVHADAWPGWPAAWPRPGNGQGSAPIRSNGTAKMSCSTNASRSEGDSVSRTTSRARPTESASDRLLCGVVAAGGDHRVRHVRVERFLVPGHPRPAAYPGRRGTRRWSATRAGSPRSAPDAVQPQPGLLDGVVGLAQRTEHPVGDGAQVRAMRLKLSGRPVCRVHCYLPSARFVIPIDDPNGAEVTAEGNNRRRQASDGESKTVRSWR